MFVIVPFLFVLLFILLRVFGDKRVFSIVLNLCFLSLCSVVFQICHKKSTMNVVKEFFIESCGFSQLECYVVTIK